MHVYNKSYKNNNLNYTLLFILYVEWLLGESCKRATLQVRSTALFSAKLSSCSALECTPPALLHIPFLFMIVKIVFLLYDLEGKSFLRRKAQCSCLAGIRCVCADLCNSHIHSIRSLQLFMLVLIVLQLYLCV